MRAALYEDIGQRPRHRDGLDACCGSTPRPLAGNLDARGRALARESVETLSGAGRGGVLQPRGPLELAELLLLQGDEREAERVDAFAERDALPSDVLVQFLCRSIRARLLGRAGDFDERAEAWRGTRSRLASLTDVLRLSRSRTPRSGRSARARGRQHAARTERERLLPRAFCARKA